MTPEHIKLFYEKPANVILEIGNGGIRSASKIGKKTDCTYSHCIKILNSLEVMGIVERKKKDGREREVHLTEKGKRVAGYFILINEELGLRFQRGVR